MQVAMKSWRIVVTCCYLATQMRWRQIYEATTELGDKNTFSNQPRATGSPSGDPARDSAGELREAPDNMFKVVSYTRNESQDAEFDGAGYQEVGLG